MPCIQTRPSRRVAINQRTSSPICCPRRALSRILQRIILTFLIVLFFVPEPFSTFSCKVDQNSFSSAPLFSFAGAQTPLDSTRTFAYFAVCGSYTKSQAASACTNADANSWLATPAATPTGNQLTGMRTALSAAVCGNCAWLNGEKIGTTYTWAGGVAVASDGWYPGQPANSPIHVALVTNGGCGYSGSSNGWANEPTTSLFNAMCMRYLCTKAQDCSNRGTAAGSYPSCTCSACDEGYGGPTCGTRICSKVLECNNQAIAVSGSYPSCTCTCKKHYGGRSCRPLTATLVPTRSKSISHSASISKSVRPIPTRTHAATETLTMSRSLLPTKSKTYHATSSATQTKTISSSKSIVSSLTPSLIVTPSITVLGTQSHSLSGSPSSTHTFSTSLSITASRSSSPSLSKSTTFTDSLSLTQSLSESISLSSSISFSASTSVSGTGTTSTSASVTTSSSVTDYSVRPTPTFTASCFYDGFGLGAENLTCVLLTPVTDDYALDQLASGFLPTTDSDGQNNTNTTGATGGGFYADGSSASNLCSDSDSDSILISYAHWTGRLGTRFVLAIRPSDKVFSYFNPEMVLPTEIVGNQDFTLINATFFPSSIGSTTAISNATDGIGNAPNSLTAQPSATSIGSTKTILGHRYVLLQVLYTGRATLSKPDPFVLYLDTRSAFKCPLAGTLAVRFQPEAAPKPDPILPSGLTEVITVLNALMMLPSAAIMLGTLTSIQSMSRCEDGDLEEELDFMNNPLGFSFGEVGVGRHQRGVLVGALVIFAGFSFLLALMSVVQWVLRRCVEKEEGTRRKKKRKQSKTKGAMPPLPLWREFLSVVAIGFPSALLPCSAFILDGVTNAAFTLMFISPSEVDKAIGAIVFAFVVTYIGHVAWITYKSPQVPEYVPLANPCESRKDTVNMYDRKPIAEDLDFDPGEENYYVGKNHPLTDISLKTLQSSCGKGHTPPLLPAATIRSKNNSFALSDVAAVVTSKTNDLLRLSFDTNLSFITNPENLDHPTMVLKNSFEGKCSGEKSQTSKIKPLLPSSPTDVQEEAPTVGFMATIGRLTKYFFSAQCEWKGSAEWDTKYHHYIADCMPRLRTYRAVELLFGNFIGALEALAYESIPFCMGKLIVALVALFALLLCVLFVKPMAVRSSIIFVSFTILIQLVAGAMMVANVKLQSMRVEAGASYLFAVATLFVLLTSLVESAWFFYENSVVAKDAILRFLALRKMRKNGMPTDFGEESSSSDEEMEDTPPEEMHQEMSTALMEDYDSGPTNDTHENDAEAIVVREILSDFQQHLLKQESSVWF